MKYISFMKDRSNTIRKIHYHTSFEIHVIQNGFQKYEAQGETFRVNEGQFLIIPPFVRHIPIDEDPCTQKYAFTFNIKPNSMFSFFSENITNCTERTHHMKLKKT